MKALFPRPALLARAHARASLQMAVDAWNAANPVGSLVVVQRSDGKWLRTRTRSEAVVLGDEAVVWVVGLYGKTPLHHVHALPPEGEVLQ